MSELDSLWGEEFNIDDSISSTKKILNKIKEPKKVTKTSQVSIKKIPLEDKLALIKENVYRILGSHKDDTLVIKTKEDFINYINVSILNGLIVIDTETNNSLDPLTCKLMGLCLATRGLKQCYVPINHVDLNTRERLPWQLTEKDCQEQLQRLIDNNVKIVFHNAKFDYKVIKCTCNVELPIYWDTIIGAGLLNENEKSGLKEQYILHIDPTQEKYSIEKLFEKMEYAIFEPELFALYAATDAMMTLKLFDYQVNLFSLEENKKLFKLFWEVEMPCIKVVAEMELRGVDIDEEYCNNLRVKYHKLFDELNHTIINEIETSYRKSINEWRLTSDANFQPKVYRKDKKPYADGSMYKLGKSKSEQLEDPINLGSPTQLAILLYDVIKCPQVSYDKPRGTGKDELEEIYAQTGLNLCNLLLQYKKLSKLLDSFLDVLLDELNPITHRIHCNFKQLGTATGRFSCSEPNLQQIPSKSKDIRLMFKARCEEHNVELNDNYYDINFGDEVLTSNGWVKVDKLQLGDVVCGDESQDIIKEILPMSNFYRIMV